jgi:hypothetical protein
VLAHVLTDIRISLSRAQYLLLSSLTFLLSILQTCMEETGLARCASGTGQQSTGRDLKPYWLR